MAQEILPIGINPNDEDNSLIINIKNLVSTNLEHFLESDSHYQKFSNSDIVLQNFLLSSPWIYKDIISLIRSNNNIVPTHYFLEHQIEADQPIVKLLVRLPFNGTIFSSDSSFVNVLKFMILPPIKFRKWNP